MDNRVLDILKIINNNGYEAYIIGGYVRDYLLNIKSNDYDICTSANIDILKNILSNYKYSIMLNTIKIIYDDISIEITPYRKELKYENRRPIEYEYTSKLIEDLQRRDFTINTICMDSNSNIIDLLSAKEDLDNNIIKCIGDIETKLREDPLRILRTLRFSAKYNFKIESNLEDNIIKLGYLVKELSYERKKEELLKLISIKRLDIVKYYNLDKYLEINIDNINNYKSNIATLVSIDYNNRYTNTKEESKIKSIMNIINKEGITNYNLYKYNDILNNIYDIDINRYNNLVIKNRKEINITSYDIISIVKDERLVEKIYKDIEISILDNKLINEHDKIIEYIKKIC